MTNRKCNIRWCKLKYINNYSEYKWSKHYSLKNNLEAKCLFCLQRIDLKYMGTVSVESQ